MEKLLEIGLYILTILFINISQAYIIHILSKIICKNNYSNKKLLINFACFLPITIIATWIYNNMPDINFVKSIITIMSSLFIIHFLYNASIIKTAIISITSVVTQFVFDITMAVLVSIIFKNIPMEEILNNKMTYYLINIIMNSLMLIVFKLISIMYNRNFKKNENIKETTININYKIIFYQGIAIIITLIPSMFLMFSNNYNFSISFVIINMIQLIIISTFSYIYTQKRILFKDTELELENTKLHNTALATINENIRGFKHDMGNMVQSINGYLAVGNIDGVKRYCQNLLHGFNDINLLSILSPKIINDPAIYGIVVSKMLVARENNLTLSLDIGLDVSKINFPSFELSRVLGILLDNAIEASLESEERKLKLEMYHDEKRKCDVIIIGNSVKDANKIDIIKMFEKDYSTKENPSGFGLYEVLKFFKKNNNGDIVPNIDYDENFFTQTVIFDK